MKKLLIPALICLAACSRETIDLQWNTNWRTDTPYELRFNPEKLGSYNWVAVCDGKELPTMLLDEGYEGGILRFEVPEGAGELSLKRGKPERKASGEVCNLFSPGTTEAEVPEWAAGRPARVEIDVENTGDIVFGVKLHMQQFDADGNRLPEEVADGRWTTNFLPPHKVIRYRERAWLRPDAKTVKLISEIHECNPRYDNYGLPISGKPLQTIEISHVALRPAAEFPFPGPDTCHFCDGVSGNKDDFGLKLDADHRFWYQTRSYASWAGAYQMRNPDDFFYPAAEGTVEAWMRPDWSMAGEEPVPIFEASHHASIAISQGQRFALGRQLFLSYHAPRRTVYLQLADADSRQFGGSAAAEIPSGEWSHIAVTFEPGGEAVLYINGRACLNVPLKGYRPVDIAGVEVPNDSHAMEFYLGSSYVNARGFTENDRKWQGIKDWCGTEFHGEADLLRISSTVRYNGDFTPERTFACDSRTRALFSFDESYNGQCGGGIGWIPAVYKSKEDLYSHVLSGSRGTIQYYPDSIVSENDAALVLTHNNYPEVPDSADFEAADRIHTESFEVKPGSRFTAVAGKAGEKVFTDWLEIENTGTETLESPIVLNSGDVDFRSYGDLAETMDAEDPNALFNYLISASDYFMTHQISFPPHSDRPHEAKDESLTVLGSYCGFECGPLNRMATLLYANAAGIPANPLNGYGHEFQQIFFGGRNHVYDLSGQRFYSNMDNETAAGLEDMEMQPGMFERVGGSCAHFIRMGTRRYFTRACAYPRKFSYSLRPGERMRLWWSNAGCSNDLQIMKRDWEIRKTLYNEEVHAEGNEVYRIDRFFPEYGNAYLEFDGKPSPDNPAFTQVSDSSFCYLVESCYPIVAASYAAVLDDGSMAGLEISTDSLRTFRTFNSPATYQVRARRGYFIRINAPIGSVSRFTASTVMHTNVRVQTGNLHPGKNALLFKADDGGRAKVSFQYRTRGREAISIPGAVDFGSIPGYEQSLLLLDPSLGHLEAELETAGLGDVSLVSAKGVNASLDGKRLRLEAEGDEPGFGWVTLASDGCEKTFTILICKGARLASAAETLSAEGQTECRIPFPEVPAGRYSVLTLDRFPGGVSAQRDRVVSLEIDGDLVPSCSGVNEGCNYYKAPFGRHGGRGNVKWDYAYSPDCSYPYDEMRVFDLPACSSMKYVYTGTPEHGTADILGMLVIPEPSRDFKCEILKNLCSVNARPWTMR